MNLTELEEYYVQVPADENAALILEKAYQNYVEPKKLDIKLVIVAGIAPDPDLGEPLPNDVAKASQKYLNANQQAIELLHQAAKYPRYRAATDLSVFDAVNPHLSDTRQAFRLLSISIWLNSEKGDADQCMKSFETNSKLLSILTNEPLLISQLVFMACESIYLRSLERSLNNLAFDDRQLQRLQELIPDEKAHLKSLQNGLIGERCFLFSGLEKEKILKAYLHRNFNLPDYLDHEAARSLLVNLCEITGCKTRDLISYLESTEKYFLVFKEPFPLRLKTAEDIEDQAKRSSFTKPITKQFSHIQNIILGKNAHSIAWCQTAKTVLAVERYRLKYRKLPETLTDLVPDFLPKVPTDPFDGRALRYRIKEGEIRTQEVKISNPQAAENQAKRKKPLFPFVKSGPKPGYKEIKYTDKGYAVYSVGKDRTDNGGSLKKYGTDSDITFSINR